MKFESKLGPAAGKDNVSTKTTVPTHIMELFDLKWGDKLLWIVETIDKDEIKVCIVPKK